ncbi:bifunctional diguanylate cyclase/phosphodiesterase [Mycolicibacterium rufum]|uniref:Bifunctional diguanylate cyclase/phosphodiesterase n=1 Tax=Mycolicibacterium rufum TaxID=318424 RepID=A0A9X3BQS7_9MYCO|nr:bifunctional diguanylate cyclase/phosphodiesterase [Mycolicibacterium rufum]KGI67954.1 diguanylate phosphodiesterase [Mycolicibacterium rufum]MCV7072852.1 bifunctional diguanylate cyclase/phosphodiesterase [Mycolicibacterium rufum]ULP38945.1 bifunctional diguanylate cyclase/phosphodiesterase [Mycolicibacterium rufum]
MGRYPRQVIALMVAPLGLVLALTALLGVAGDNPAVRIIDDLLNFGLLVYATVCAALAARSALGRLRRAWALMTAALAAWAIGDGIWLLYELILRQEAPVPSAADAFYVVFAVLAVAAMTQFVTEPMRESRLRIALDGITVALCLFLLAWILALHTVYDAYRDDRAALFVALLYPASDLAMLTIAVVTLLRAEARQRVVLTVLSGAIAVMAVADITYAVLVAGDNYRTGDPIDAVWGAAAVLFAAAALISRRTPTPRPPTLPVPSNASLWLPYVPLLLAGTVGPPLVMTGVERFLVPVIVVAVCLRQSVSAWENRRLLTAAADQALRDPLTGLANTALFDDRLAHAMVLRSRIDRSVAVLSLDLDDFKLINDNLGHSTADRLLADVGRRLADCARTGDTVARTGGDEFALLLEGPFDESDAVARRVSAAFDIPFTVDGHDILLRPSIGVTVASMSEPDLTPEVLRERAAIAMHAAKRARSPEVQTFSADMVPVNGATVDGAARAGGDGAAQIRLLGELRQAIDHHGLDVVYQPKISLSSGETVGVEALLRWPHPQLGLLLPETFLSLIREQGLIQRVTDLVLDKALDDAVRWYGHDARIPVAVNLFAPSLRETDQPDKLCRALGCRGLPTDLLTVEITEDIVLSEMDLVTAVLRRLREYGVRVAIDDFGSGYSSLSYLRDLAIDEVKLDRNFIAPVTSDPRAAAVAQAVIDLTHDLGATVVAEGIEDVATADWLRDHGCDVGQGYLFGRPVEAAQIGVFAGADIRDIDDAAVISPP